MAQASQGSPITLTVQAFCQSTGLGRTTCYNLIKQGKLSAIKVGRRTLITAASIEALFGGGSTPLGQGGR